MRFILAVLFVFISIPATTAHAEKLNAGFVQGIWFSEPTVFVGDTVRVYVALRNNTDHDLTGTIRFDDAGTRIGNSYVSALPGRLVEGWVDWTPTYGEHKITATLTDISIHEVGKSPEQTQVADMIAEHNIDVDLDTDNDGIGNKIDTDDDSDGISDNDEVKNNTDPLVKNNIVQKETTRTESEPKETLIAASASQKTVFANAEEGLEKFTDNSIADTTLQTVTEKIAETKEVLDTYRESRKNELDTYIKGERTSDSFIASSTDTLATITRSRIQNTDQSFLMAVIDGGKALISGVYTLILWLTSNALGHPAILELILLVGILYFVYRTARSFGRRPRY